MLSHAAIRYSYIPLICFGWGTPAIAGDVKQDLSECPKGQIRTVVEVIETPAIIKDIYGKVETISSAGSAERFVPAVTKWIDIPKDYIRPKTIKSVLIRRTRAQYTPKYEPYIFRKQSHDIIHLLNGTVERRRVPAIWTQRISYTLDPSTIRETREETERSYDPEVMEKNGKLNVVVSPASGGQIQNSRLIQRDAIVSQERVPAKIRQHWGNCKAAAPE